MLEPLDRREELLALITPDLETGLNGSNSDKARTAYFAIALGKAKELKAKYPKEWKQAVESLQMFPKIIQSIFNAPLPSGEEIQKRAAAEGLKKASE